MLRKVWYEEGVFSDFVNLFDIACQQVMHLTVFKQEGWFYWRSVLEVILHLYFFCDFETQ